MSETGSISGDRGTRVFISYRRADSSGHAGRLFDRLAGRFGRGAVFMDVAAIDAGADFVTSLEEAVASCAVEIVIIGRRWLEAAADGRRRLDDPEDFVHREVAAGLGRDITVIPVLVDGATMPGPAELPGPLVELARRNAHELSDSRWDFDVQRLCEVIAGSGVASAPVELGSSLRTLVAIGPWPVEADSELGGRGVAVEAEGGRLGCFERPFEAVSWAETQRARLAGRGEAEVRAAVHLGEVDLARGPSGVITASGPATTLTRALLAAAAPGQILLTRGAFDLARRGSGAGDLEWRAHGRYVLSDLSEPEALFEAGRAGTAPLTPPPDSEHARRVDGDELVLGWRPSPGQAIPGRTTWVLERRLGEGGFGEVWLAGHAKTREERVFKFCFSTAQVRSLQREAVLFRLLKEELGDRRDISRVLDWRFDEAPYFLELEYTSGGSMADWMAARGGAAEIDLHHRLELVAQAAEALAAAHSVGVLHKDIKPQNILVVEADDGRLEARLSDFGIGLVTDRRRLEEAGITVLGLTELETDTTSAGSRLYLAPELLEGKAATLQADIYALGVVLYQLVVGDLRRALAPGWQRDITDELLLEDIGACVDGDPERRLRNAHDLAGCLRGLEDRRRRREEERRRAEAAEAALADLVVSRRRRRQTALIAAVLAVFAVAMGVQSWRIHLHAQRAEAEAATAAATADFLGGLFEVVGPDQLGYDTTGLEILAEGARRARQELDGQPELQARLMTELGSLYALLGLFDEATPLAEESEAIARTLPMEGRPVLALCLSNLGLLALDKGDLPAAEAAVREALELWRGLDDVSVLTADLNNLAMVLSRKGDLEAAEPIFTEAIARARAEDDPQLATFLSNFGLLRHDRGDLDGAEALYREAVAINEGSHSGDNPALSDSLNNLATLCMDRGRLDEAEDLLRRVLAMNRRLYGDDHPRVATALNNLGLLLDGKGDPTAEATVRQALDMYRRLLPRDHPDVASSASNLALILLDRGDLEAAAELFEEAVRVNRRALGADHPTTARTEVYLASVCAARGDAARGEELASAGLAVLEHELPGDSVDVVYARGVLGACVAGLDRREEGEALLVAAISALESGRPEQASELRHHLVRLYQAWGRSREAAEQRASLEASEDGEPR